MGSKVAKLLTAGMALFSMLLAPSGHAASTPDATPIKVVYHIDDTTRASALLQNVANQLRAVPGTKIAVVAHGKGIDFMLNNAQDANGNPYNVMMETLAQQGVDFKICNNTLKGRHLTAADVAYPVVVVPSGVAEIARLQAQEGYVYVKP
ncbi:MAG: DsrE family protein [Sulfuriferula sp.]|nr:DsrE family protein [Sulfuriferula sp.]